MHWADHCMKTLTALPILYISELCLQVSDYNISSITSYLSNFITSMSLEYNICISNSDSVFIFRFSSFSFSFCYYFDLFGPHRKWHSQVLSFRKVFYIFSLWKWLLIHCYCYSCIDSLRYKQCQQSLQFQNHRSTIHYRLHHRHYQHHKQHWQPMVLIILIYQSRYLHLHRMYI